VPGAEHWVKDPAPRAATDTALTARHAAMMARVAQDRLARLEHALTELPHLAGIKKNSGAKDATPRVSTTDPDARVMKMPEHAATAETVNADAKAHRSMAATALRGLAKVTGNACVFALTYSILRFITMNA
jgi:hypothetical protein